MSDTQTPPTPALTGLAAIEALLAPHRRSDAPGLVVGIAHGGKTIFRRGYGLANLEHGVANTPHTRMRLASTSKHFTSLAILLLAEDGLLDIDDLVHKHLPELPDFGPAGPTLRQLMHHTGGMRSDAELSAMVHGLTILPKGAAIDLLSVQSELNFAPGSHFIYSNGGYRMLAKVVAKLSGMSFERFLVERICQPLGMLDTQAAPSDFEVHAGLAGLYQALPSGGWQHGMYVSTETNGSGSMISTVDDMLRWLAHMRSPDKKVGTPASWALMTSSTTLSTGTVIDYGLGLMRETYRGVEMLHHSGGWMGGSAQMLTVPAHGLDIIAISNGAGEHPVLLAQKIVDALLAEHLTEPPEQRMDASRYPAMIGQRYHAASTGAVLEFSEMTGRLGVAKLCLGWVGYLPTPARIGPKGPWLAAHDVAAGPIEVDASDWDGKTVPATITVADGGNVQLMQRLIPEEAPTAAALAPQLVGRYRAPDLNASAEVVLQGERLLLRMQGQDGRVDLVLKPLSSEVLHCVGADPMLAQYGGGTVNVDRQGEHVIGLRMDNLRTRHIRLFRLLTEETAA